MCLCPVMYIFMHGYICLYTIVMHAVLTLLFRFSDSRTIFIDENSAL
jgi:hypothetical protein